MSAVIEKEKRIIAEKQLTVARRVLEKIGYGHSVLPERDALEALDEMFRIGPKQQLQGLVGHERR